MYEIILKKKFPFLSLFTIIFKLKVSRKLSIQDDKNDNDGHSIISIDCIIAETFFFPFLSKNC